MHKFAISLCAVVLLTLGMAQQLTTAISSNPPTLDPQRTFNGFSFAVTNQVYETLVDMSAEGEIVARLATDWEYIDPNTLQLRLREGVTFHDGTEFDASAVKASLERLLDPDTGAPGRFVVSAIREVNALDPLTVEIITAEPFAPLLAHLAHPVASIVPVEQAESLARNPVGTGPYTFIAWLDGSEISLQANPTYWGGAPAIASLIYRIIPEVSTQIVELRAGGLDIIFNLPPDNFVSLQQEDSLVTESFLGWGSAHLGFNTANPQLEDLRVRQAIAHAIDKELIVEVFLQGLAEPAVVPIPPTVRFAAELAEPFPYDPDRARALLAEAGTSDVSLRLDIFQNPDLEAVAQVLQAMLADVGITLDIRIQEFAAYSEAVQREDAELYGTTWGTVTLDADYTLYAFFHASEIPQNNLSRYANDVVNALLDEARATPDAEVREAAYATVQAQVLEDVPMVTLYYPLSTYAKRNVLQGEVITFSWIKLDLRSATLLE